MCAETFGMKFILTTFVLALTWCDFVTAGEPSLHLAFVHRDSTALARGGNVPQDDLLQDYQILCQRNELNGYSQNLAESGLLVRKASLLEDKDFVGYEAADDSWGNLAAIIHLRLRAREVLKEKMDKAPEARVALVVDNEWVLCTTGFENLTPDRGFIAMSIMSRRDEYLFLRLSEGKRGKILEKEMDDYDRGQKEMMATVPKPTLKAEQDSAEKPATRAESNSKSGDKLQPELEGRSR